MSQCSCCLSLFVDGCWQPCDTIIYTEDQTICRHCEGDINAHKILERRKYHVAKHLEAIAEKKVLHDVP